LFFWGFPANSVPSPSILAPISPLFWGSMIVSFFPPAVFPGPRRLICFFCSGGVPPAICGPFLRFPHFASLKSRSRNPLVFALYFKCMVASTPSDCNACWSFVFRQPPPFCVVSFPPVAQGVLCFRFLLFIQCALFLTVWGVPAVFYSVGHFSFFAFVRGSSFFFAALGTNGLLFGPPLFVFSFFYFLAVAHFFLRGRRPPFLSATFVPPPFQLAFCLFLQHVDQFQGFEFFSLGFFFPFHLPESSARDIRPRGFVFSCFLFFFFLFFFLALTPPPCFPFFYFLCPWFFPTGRVTQAPANSADDQSFLQCPVHQSTSEFPARNRRCSPTFACASHFCLYTCSTSSLIFRYLCHIFSFSPCPESVSDWFRLFFSFLFFGLGFVWFPSYPPV